MQSAEGSEFPVNQYFYQYRVVKLNLSLKDMIKAILQ